MKTRLLSLLQVACSGALSTPSALRARQPTVTRCRIACTLRPPPRFTADVNAATGLCADGRVRICASAGKGLGAFAMVALSPNVASSSDGLVRGEHQLGEYRGEVYNQEGMQARYGTDGAADAGWREQWRASREARGVGVTGSYIFTVSDALDPWAELLYVDAEDSAHALWTRYVNHSAQRPNVAARSSNGLSDARTTLRIVVISEIAAGEELLIDYGHGFAFGQGEEVA